MDSASIANNKLRISIEKTIFVLGPLVKYPRLEVKYLQRPPFLFVHDIVTYVIRNHGFLNGLFSNDELNRNTVKTCKQKRADFLKKLVHAIRTVTGDRIPDCNWNKLASGGLPMVTNRILRSVANAISKKMNCTLAIKKMNGTFDNEEKFNNEFQKRKWNDENENISEENLDNKKRPRQLTIWDIEVEDEEFIDNFEALNDKMTQTLEAEYEKERSDVLASKYLAPYNSISNTPAPGLENELEAMELF